MTAAAAMPVAISQIGQPGPRPNAQESNPRKRSSQPAAAKTGSKWAFRFARTETKAAPRKRTAQAIALARTAPGRPPESDSRGRRVERPRHAANEDSASESTTRESNR